MVTGPISVMPGSVAAVLDGGTVKAYSETGEFLWSYFTRHGLCPYVTRSDQGIAFVCDLDGNLIAVNGTGRELWKHGLGGVLSGPVITGWDGRVFVPAAGKIFCLTSSGTLLWTYGPEGKIAAGPVPDKNGGITLALENGVIINLDHFGAAVSRKLPGAPALIVPLENGILALYENGDILRVAFPIEDSVPITLPRLAAKPLAAAGRDGRAAVFLAGGQIALIDGNDGKVLWTARSLLRPGPDEKAGLVFDKRGVYALCAGGAAGFTTNGEPLWTANLDNASGVPALGDDGVLYSGGKDWLFNARKLEDRTPPDGKTTLYGPAPEFSYGTGNPPPSVFSHVIGRFYEMTVKSELEIIEKGVSSGKVGVNEPDWTAYLMETADGGYRPGTANSREPRTVINQRIQALRLLSRIGSVETVPWLVAFFRRENEPLVKIASARAIGAIGVDPEGKAIREFTGAVKTGNPVSNEQLFIAIAAATGDICRFSGPPLYDIGRELLELLNGPGQTPLVRRQARYETDTLKR